MNQSVKIEKPASTDAGFLFALGWKMGLEPTTFGTTIRRSNQLSYVHHISHFLSNAGAKIIPILILCKDIAKKTLIFFAIIWVLGCMRSHILCRNGV